MKDAGNEIRKAIKRLVREKVYASLERELLPKGRAIQTDLPFTHKRYLKLLTAAAIGSSLGIFAVTSVYLIFVWLLHLQLY